MRISLGRFVTTVAAVSAQNCDRLKAWIHVDGTKSFSTFISDRGTYVQNVAEALAKSFTTFSYGVSLFGDRQPDVTGPQDTCYYAAVENPATSAAVTSFMSSYTEVDDGKDQAESSIDTSMYLLAHKWAPSSVAELRTLIIITDAPGKTKGEGVSAGTEGTTALVAPDACVTCDNAFQLPTRDFFVEMLVGMDVSPVIITTSGAALEYWSKLVSDVGRGGVLVSSGDGAKDAARVVSGLMGLTCSRNAGSSKKKSNTGAVAGAIIGALLFLLLLGFVVWWFFLRNGGNKTNYPAPQANGKKASIANDPAEHGDDDDEEDDEDDEDEEDEDDDEDDDEEDEDEEEV